MARGTRAGTRRAEERDRCCMHDAGPTCQSPQRQRRCAHSSRRHLTKAKGHKRRPSFDFFSNRLNTCKTNPTVGPFGSFMSGKKLSTSRLAAAREVPRESWGGIGMRKCASQCVSCNCVAGCVERWQYCVAGCVVSQCQYCVLYCVLYCVVYCVFQCLSCGV